MNTPSKIRRIYSGKLLNQAKGSKPELQPKFPVNSKVDEKNPCKVDDQK